MERKIVEGSISVRMAGRDIERLPYTSGFQIWMYFLLAPIAGKVRATKKWHLDCIIYLFVYLFSQWHYIAFHTATRTTGKRLVISSILALASGQRIDLSMGQWQ